MPPFFFALDRRQHELQSSNSRKTLDTHSITQDSLYLHSGPDPRL